MGGLLFIDDEEGIRRSIMRALKGEAYKIYTADNGETGIAFVKENRPPIATVISDFKMPGLNGLETLKQIGAINPELTRIILTGYATVEAAIEATNEGIDGFLTKPFDNIELRTKIREISIKKHLRKFVPEQVYREIEKSPWVMEPTFHEVSILFSDIRNFTRMTRKVPPEDIVAFLNDYYFTPMGEIAYRFNGTVDKHMGDGIMVVFGSPVSKADDAIRAVDAALVMQKTAAEINRNLNGNGLRLKTGIGISTGKVFSGILGSLRRKEYTSIGLAVNIASRLQGMAEAGDVIISDETFRKISNRFRTEPLVAVTVKGMDRPITVHRVLGKEKDGTNLN